MWLGAAQGRIAQPAQPVMQPSHFAAPAALAVRWAQPVQPVMQPSHFAAPVLAVRWAQPVQPAIQPSHLGTSTELAARMAHERPGQASLRAALRFLVVLFVGACVMSALR